MKNYNKLLDNIKDRRVTDSIIKAFDISGGFNKNEYGSTLTYVFEAMRAINEEYTNNTYLACQRLQEHLIPGLFQQGINIGFDYQGSVVTNTHIKTYSDIDMLMIHGLFYHLEPPQIPPIPYYGNAIADLKELREKAKVILDTVFSSCVIDDSGSKALKISGGTLRRQIELIPAGQYHSIKYSETANKFYLGMNILDRENNSQILNYPFAHAENINRKDQRVAGNLKGLIRLIKTLKVDADVQIKLSSYDIASIVFRMPDEMLLVPFGKRLQLLINCRDFFNKIVSDTEFRNGLYVANGTRKIFCDEGSKRDEFIKLTKEVADVVLDIAQDIKPLLERELIYE